MNGSRNKILLFLVGILLLANIVMLVFFVGKKSPGKDRSHSSGRSRSEVMRDFLKDSVGFNEQQLAQFDQIREQHRDSVKTLFDDMRNAKMAFYKQAGQSDTAAQMAAADVIAQKQKALDVAFFTHFQDIRQLCTPEQITRYDSLVQKIVRRMVSGGPRGEPRQKKEDKQIKK
jgi:periplasmic protein CpxP/Spy